MALEYMALCVFSESFFGIMHQAKKWKIKMKMK